MLTLFDFHSSGNGYKARLLMNFLRRPFRYVEVDILKGESRTDDFLARNPNGRIPVLQIGESRHLAESNAILYWLAEGTPWWPDDTLERARVLSWMFFEQYSHEPNIATSRFILTYRDIDEPTRRLLAQKKELGHAALAVMERHIRAREWFVSDAPTIADIALYAYTHVAGEGDFDLQPYPGVRAWLARVAALPHYTPITDTDGLSD